MKKKAAMLALSLLLALQAAACGGGGEQTFSPDGTLSGGDPAFSLSRLTAADDYGRTMAPSGGAKTDQDRYVGLFYFLWSGQYNSAEVLDVNQMLYDGDPSLWAAENVQEFHHWGEPLFGYYNSADPWVIRKHVELLTLAGVDFLVFDVTNNTLYYDVLDTLLPILQEYHDAGWDVPKFVFYTNSNSARVIRALYAGDPDSTVSDYTSTSELAREGIYRAGKYEDLWFCPNGKPLIIGIAEDNDGASDQIRWPSNAAVSPEETALDPVADAEILNFFEIKESQWPTTGVHHENGFPWIEFSADPTLYGDTVSVSVAQHNLLPFSDALLSAEVAERMWGRGWHDGAADHSLDAVYSGQNFEERYQKAMELDPTYLFVTGWNEWVAQKQYGANSANTQYGGISQTRVSFVDTVNTEYSRDVEMMKDGYFDNFYLQMARNNRAYKETAFSPVYDPAVTIDLSAGLTQWNAVQSVYCDFVGEAPARNFRGHAASLTYTAPAARNDIVSVRAASDGEAVCFLIETAEDVQADPETGDLPRLYLQIPGAGGGWSGYQFEVTLNNGRAEVFALGGDRALTRSSAGTASYSRGGKYLQVRIPKSLLGLGDNFQLNFKVTDGCDIADVSTFYTQGDACPLGRMNFAFFGA